jgi:alginate O-acetyltransferase complex protein AlgI
VLFNSWGYVVFLFVAVLLHWLLPRRFRVALLGAFSVLFYAMWRWEFVLLIVFSAGIDFLSAARVFASEDARVRRAWLLLSLSTNLGLLVVFKYAYFLSDNAVGLLGGLGYEGHGIRDWGIEIILPLGISFYTFQTICYTIDVYRRVIEPERDFLHFFTYVTFWPQLIAGPILRASEVMPQLKADRRLAWDDISEGTFQIFVGLCKKVVIADSLALLVDEAFGTELSRFTGFDAWVATLLFGFQIYFDFAGYSDIAIGSARLLGIRFPKNFDWPYLATSPRDFWNRWHISLSSWIRDYLYVPLTGGHFQGKSVGGLAVASENVGHQRFIALFSTWFIMGLWHGASWNFALWGVYHAALVFLYRAVPPLQRLGDRAPALAWMILFPLVMAGWIPFRTQTLGDAFLLYGKLLDPTAYHLAGRALIGHSYLAAAVLVAGMLLFALARKAAEKHPLPSGLRGPAMCLAVAVMTVALLALQRPVNQFIYFQF